MIKLVNVESVEFDSVEEFDNEVSKLKDSWDKIVEELGVEEEDIKKGVYIEWRKNFKIEVSEEFMIEWGLDIIKELLFSYGEKE